MKIQIEEEEEENAVETVAATDCGIRLRTSTGEASTPSATSTPSSTSTTDESRRALDARGLALFRHQQRHKLHRLQCGHTPRNFVTSTPPDASSPSRSLAAPSIPSTRIILRRAPLYGLSRTELHRAGIASSSPPVTRQINSSRRLHCAT